MDKNRFSHLIIVAAALCLSACGAAAESSVGDSKATGASPPVNTAGPAPASNVAPSAVASNADASPATQASPGSAAAQQGAPPAPAPGASTSAPAAKAPKPQIGSGGNDLFLFTQARAAINGDDDLKSANVVIEVKEGVITLSGNVASAALKSKAEELARGAGAKAVKNQLRVSAAR